MTNKLNTQFFFVAPLEVVKVTRENMEEAAAWCGGKVATVESRKVAGRMDPYVWVPTPSGTKISWAFAGMYITRRIIVTLNDELAYSYQVYRRNYFEKNYFPEVGEAVDKTWERAAKQNGSKKASKKVAQKTPSPEDLAVAARQTVEAETGDDDTMPAAILHDQALVQANRDKNRIRRVEDVQLPDDSASLGEAVALVEREMGGEVIETINLTGVDIEGETPVKIASEVPVENLRGL
jgi:hypothetical protein